MGPNPRRPARHRLREDGCNRRRKAVRDAGHQTQMAKQTQEIGSAKIQTPLTHQMGNTFHIPGPLRDFSEQRGEVQISGSPRTLLGALQLLWAKYPGLRDRILNEQGHIREHINIFVGNESVRYTGDLATPLPLNATISIIPAISGGAPLQRGTSQMQPRKQQPKKSLGISL